MANASGLDVDMQSCKCYEYFFIHNAHTSFQLGANVHACMSAITSMHAL